MMIVCALDGDGLVSTQNVDISKQPIDENQLSSMWPLQLFRSAISLQNVRHQPSRFLPENEKNLTEKIRRIVRVTQHAIETDWHKSSKFCVLNSKHVAGAAADAAVCE